MPETFGRPPITEPIKQAIRDAFAVVPDGKRGAMLAIADASGVRMHIAVKVNDTWKVGGAVRVPTDGSRPDGYVAVEASW
jgi:hypothetical protein